MESTTLGGGTFMQKLRTQKTDLTGPTSRRSLRADS